MLHGLQIYFFLHFLFYILHNLLNIRIFIINFFESREIWLFTIHISERSFFFHLTFMILSLFCLKFLITIIFVNYVFLKFIKRLNNRSCLGISLFNLHFSILIFLRFILFFKIRLMIVRRFYSCY